MAGGAAPGSLILVVDPDPGFGDQVSLLTGEHRVVFFDTPREGAAAAAGGRFDLALIGPGYAHEEGMAGLAGLRCADPALPTVLVVEVGSNRVLRAALRAGIREVVDAPLSARKMAEILSLARPAACPGRAEEQPDPVRVVIEGGGGGGGRKTLETTTTGSGVLSHEGGGGGETWSPEAASAGGVIGPVVTAPLPPQWRDDPRFDEAPGPAPAGPLLLPAAPPYLPDRRAPDAALPTPAPDDGIPPPAPAAPPTVEHERRGSFTEEEAAVGSTDPDLPGLPPVTDGGGPAPEPPAALPPPPPFDPGEKGLPPLMPSMPPPMAASPIPGGPEPQPVRSPASVMVRRPGEGRIVAVVAGKGGSGKTVTSINLAAALAGRLGEGRVAVVDADLQFGDVALLLQLDPDRTIADAARMLDHLTEARLDSMLLRHGSGIRVLAAPPVPAAGAGIAPKSVVQLAEMMRGMFDFVVLDTSPVFDDGLMALLEHADDILLVVEMDLPSVKNGRIVLDTLRAMRFDMSRVRVVLNRSNSKARLDLGELERSLGEPVAATIPSDRLVTQSVNEGVPAVAFSPRSKVAKAFHSLARQFLPR